MADWKLVTGAARGKCPKCGQFLRHADTVLAPPEGSYHSYLIPGADWKAP